MSRKTLEQVAAAYESVVRQSRSDREQDELYAFRATCNWLKSVLLQAHALCPNARRVVDLCCGQGSDATKVAHLRNLEHYVGIDLSRAHIDEAQKRISASRKTTAMFAVAVGNCADAEELRAMPVLQKCWGASDLVLCHFALHYFCESRQFLTNFLRSVAALLQPRGGLFIGTVLDWTALRQLFLARDGPRSPVLLGPPPARRKPHWRPTADRAARQQRCMARMRHHAESGSRRCRMLPVAEVPEVRFQGRIRVVAPPATVAGLLQRRGGTRTEPTCGFGLRVNVCVGERLASPEFVCDMGDVRSIAQASGLKLIFQRNLADLALESNAARADPPARVFGLDVARLPTVDLASLNAYLCFAFAKE